MTTICPDDKAAADFVEGQLVGDALVRLETHLAECSSCLTLIAELRQCRSQTVRKSLEPKAQQSLDTDARWTSEATRIGRFTLRRVVGRGGMAVVFAAHDPQLDREVAIKVVQARSLGIADSTPNKRLLQEAQSLAQLAHPNVVPVYDVHLETADPNGEVYVVMELVEGGTLAQWLQLPRSQTSIIETFIAAGQGLAAAHDKQIIHRDFKPSNVLLRPDGQVLVSDFGLAGATYSREPAETAGSLTALQPLATSTEGTSIVGTPAYMSPEQHRGRTIGTAADQFSFCVALYEALCGHRPFRGKSVAELQANVLGHRLRPMPRSLPRSVRHVLLRGLRSDPAARYPNMRALLSDLGNAITARKRRRLALMATTMAVVVGCATYVMWPSDASAVCDSTPTADQILEQQWSPARQANIRARLTASGIPGADDTLREINDTLGRYAVSVAEMSYRSCKATRITGQQAPELFERRKECLRNRRVRVEALLSLLEQPLGGRALRRSRKAMWKAISLESCANDGALLAEPIVPSEPDPIDSAERDRLEAQLAKVYALDALGDIKGALATATDLTASANAKPHKRILAKALFLRAFYLRSLGQIDEAIPAYRKSARAAASAKHDQFLLKSLVGVSIALGENGRPVEALATLEHADVTLTRTGVGPIIKARIHDAKARTLLTLGDYHKALENYRAAAELFTAHGTDKMQYMALNNLAHGLRMLRKFGEAERILNKALPLGERAYGKDNSQLLVSLHNLGIVLHRQGKPSQGQPYVVRALELTRSSRGPTHSYFASGLSALSAIESDLGQHKQAVKNARRAVEIFKQHDNADVTAGGLIGLARALGAHGDVQKAHTQFRRAVAYIREHLPENHPKLGDALYAFGTWALSNRRRNKGIRLLERALKVRATKSPNDLAYAESALALADAISATDRERARQLYREVLKAYKASLTESDERIAKLSARLSEL